MHQDFDPFEIIILKITNFDIENNAIQTNACLRPSNPESRRITLILIYVLLIDTVDSHTADGTSWPMTASYVGDGNHHDS